MIQNIKISSPVKSIEANLPQKINREIKVITQMHRNQSYLLFGTREGEGEFFFPNISSLPFSAISLQEDAYENH